MSNDNSNSSGSSLSSSTTTQRSGGPQTPQGKAISSQNARKDGFAAKTFSGEDAKIINNNYGKLVEEFGIESFSEKTAAKRLATIMFKLAKLDSREFAVSDTLLNTIDSETGSTSIYYEPDQIATLEVMRRYRVQFLKEYDSLLSDLNRVKTIRESKEEFDAMQSDIAVEMAQKIIKQQLTKKKVEHEKELQEIEGEYDKLLKQHDKLEEQNKNLRNELEKAKTSSKETNKPDNSDNKVHLIDTTNTRAEQDKTTQTNAQYTPNKEKSYETQNKPKLDSNNSGPIGFSNDDSIDSSSGARVNV